jgi:serine/threonine-protein kinase
MIGQRLQQYLIVEKAGEGGMGVVWKARDTRLDRDVALKVLPHGLANDIGRERFAREAKSASALNHPNIVTIYGIDSDSGVDFIAMEFIRGETLAHRLASGPLDISVAIAYATQIADALSCAHEAGIIHRDLKPSNIMIANTGSLSGSRTEQWTAMVKVLDFGLAKVSAPESAADIAQTPTVAPLTVAGVLVGTPDYMSPEQALGEPVDKRSDVFSFGVLLYLMLAGKRPFRGSSRSELLRQLHLTAPTPIETLRPDVPRALASLVMKALEKAPDNRFASMTDVRHALARLQLPPAAANVPTSKASQVEWRRIVSLVAVASTLIVGAWLIYRALPHRESETTIQTAPEGTAPPQTPYELTQRAAQLLQRQDRPGNVDSAIQTLEQVLKGDANFAPAHAFLAEAYRRRNSTNPDPQWARLAAEGARRALELNPDLALAHTAQGFVDFDAGRYADAERRWRRAMELDPNSAMPYVGLGMAFAAQTRDLEAEAALQEAVKRRGSDWRPDSELGTFYLRRGRYEAAAKAWESARELAADNTILWRNLGAVYFQLERYDDAASAFQRSLEIAPSAAAYTNLGTLRFYQGRYHDAVPAFEKAVELGANRSLYWGNLADAYRWTPGRRGDSIGAYDRAIALLREDIKKQPAVVELRSRLAVYLVKSNRADEAVSLIKELGNEPSLTTPVLIHLTIVNELAKDRDSALKWLERALKAGYSEKELANEPELASLRADSRYHRLLTAVRAQPLAK